MKHHACSSISALYLGVSLASFGCTSNSSSDELASQDGESSQSETAASTAQTTDGSESGSETGEPDPISYADPGEYAVGNLAMDLADPLGDRDLRIELWYPATGAAAGAGQTLIDFALDGADAASLQALIDIAPD